MDIVKELVGERYAARIAELAVTLYSKVRPLLSLLGTMANLDRPGSLP